MIVLNVVVVVVFVVMDIAPLGRNFGVCLCRFMQKLTNERMNNDAKFGILVYLVIDFDDMNLKGLSFQSSSIASCCPPSVGRHGSSKETSAVRSISHESLESECKPVH